MRFTHYSLKKPLEDGTYEEIIFNSAAEICKYLKTSDHTLYAILHGTCKYKHYNTKHLKDYIITALEDNPNNEIAELQKRIKEEKYKLNQMQYLQNQEKRKLEKQFIMQHQAEINDKLSNFITPPQL